MADLASRFQTLIAESSPDEQAALLLGCAIVSSALGEGDDDVQGFQQRPSIVDALKDLESQDKMGNFEIQRLTAQAPLARSIFGGPLIGT